MDRATIWALCVALGVFTMWCMRHTTKPTVDAVLIRIAACLFMAAGTVGAGGQVGQTIASVIQWVTRTSDDTTRTLLGASVTWMLWAVLSILWILGMVPKKWFNWDPPDWLMFLGVVIPTTATAIPGPVGDAIREAINFITQMMTTPLRNGFDI